MFHESYHRFGWYRLASMRYARGVDHRRRDFHVSGTNILRTKDMHPLTITFARRIDGRDVGLEPRAADSISFIDMRASRTLVVGGCVRLTAFVTAYDEQPWIDTTGAGAGDGGPLH